MSVTVRRMRTQDAEAVLRIDEKITGRPHEAQWEARIIDHVTGNPLGCLVAEADGKIVGFILGEIRGWEFAIPKSGWIEIVGVDPEFQGRGVAKALIEKLNVYFQNHNVEKVRLMVNWNDGGLVSFFRAVGFERSEFIILEKGVETPE
ncbi:MAG TPA: GNAT family N-acetyltransferase [Candidatus Deferrimicrobiaceae bacterium]|nr:MAG: GCN5-related N-acetyltransferase BamK [Deltaproteobacteria bacterium CSP1-8]HJX14321.1 GNAT family N-acetyltransferase [Candidatus Deferrimicrobiaceae bacterium]